MSELFSNASMLEMYIFETTQLIEQLENIILEVEKTNAQDEDYVNEIFRIMHTIKGSSAMMLFDSISNLAHSIEDLFYFIRDQKPTNINNSNLCDLIFEAIDFIKVELAKLKSGDKPDEDSSQLALKIKEFLLVLKEDNPDTGDIIRPKSEAKKQYYIAPDLKRETSATKYYFANIKFEKGCDMENIRAYTVINNLKNVSEDLINIPEDIIEDDKADYIKVNGFDVYIKSKSGEKEIIELLNKTPFLENIDFRNIENGEGEELFKKPDTIVLEKEIKYPKVETQEEKAEEKVSAPSHSAQNVISVSVPKLDQLMDLVGEMVIAEAMVTQNPDLEDLELENFSKSARQLRKITNELQDIVMSIRMVPLSTTFLKMYRIVRDISKKQKKEVELQLIGEETEVDKNIIEHIGDPLMHLIRNAVDHGIEDGDTREAKGKNRAGKITLEAKNVGSDVLILIKDDGKGLNRDKLIEKGIEKGLIDKDPEELSDKEVYNLILNPGFSTKENVTEFSGRGVGMDVVVKNLEEIGGSIVVDSAEDKGTVITLKIPLTLAIIDGMNVRVGTSRYTIPIMNVKESFRPVKEQLIKDPDGNEMIMLRGRSHTIYRLHQLYNVETEIKDLTEGILVVVEQNERTSCILVDELLGQQPVVVKALPNYIKSTKNIKGLGGCTLLGDGSISLILDVNGIEYI
ncbi:MAG: chemotaxis protein CheA [Tissierellaceae bacterium]|nr:chemotaxis protein CheA [Tissierellaceae bacterium]